MDSTHPYIPVHWWSREEISLGGRSPSNQPGTHDPSTRWISIPPNAKLTLLQVNICLTPIAAPILPECSREEGDTDSGSPHDRLGAGKAYFSRYIWFWKVSLDVIFGSSSCYYFFFEVNLVVIIFWLIVLVWLKLKSMWRFKEDHLNPAEVKQECRILVMSITSLHETMAQIHMHAFVPNNSKNLIF